jgi:hypothetical protein
MSNFSSRVFPGEPIINESTPEHVTHDAGEGCSRGLTLEDRPREGYAYSGFARKFTDDLLIPRSEWQARIEERQEKSGTWMQLTTALRVPHKNQQSTNFCWANAPVHAAELLRVRHGLPYVSLSPASIACKIKNFRNVGGWGLDAVKYSFQNGIATSAAWPDTAIDRRWDRPETWEAAKSYRYREWIECEPRNLDQLVSCLLRDIPMPGGYNWWGHQITNCDPIWLDGTVAIRIRNSWQNWGKDGYGILQGNRMLPDDACGPISVRAANTTAKGSRR